jgi:hypothetical protein
MMNEDIEIGDHVWAILKPDRGLLVARKITSRDYVICGKWTIDISYRHLDIIDVIDRPSGYEASKLF